jgi:hypothetical protein
VSLDEELRRAADAALGLAGDGESVEAVLATEPSPGRRLYICSFTGPARSWVVIDASGEPVTSRAVIREAVSIAALCEVAGDTAGGGELEELRRQLVALRLTEGPAGIEEAEDAALALERAVGAPPRLATPDYLDDVGAATRRLERALGDDESPFTRVMASAIGAVESLASEVEAGYKRELT